MTGRQRFLLARMRRDPRRRGRRRLGERPRRPCAPARARRDPGARARTIARARLGFRSRAYAEPLLDRPTRRTKRRSSTSWPGLDVEGAPIFATHDEPLKRDRAGGRAGSPGSSSNPFPRWDVLSADPDQARPARGGPRRRGSRSRERHIRGRRQRRARARPEELGFPVLVKSRRPPKASKTAVQAPGAFRCETAAEVRTGPMRRRSRTSRWCRR